MTDIGNETAEDAQLLKDFAAGNHDALSEFVGRWETSMFKVACRITGQPADAEDIRQIVMLRIIEHPDRLARVANVAAWIRRCVVNESLTWLRNRKRDRAVALDSCDEAAISGDLDDEETQRLREAMKFMTAEMRALLALRFDEGLTIREIAETMDTPHTTIQGRLAAAIVELRTRLGVVTN